MAKVTIITKGIGLFYFKDEMWKIMFPFDTNFSSDVSCHRVKFSFRKDGEADSEPVVLANPNRSLNIEVKNAASGSLASAGSDIGEFLDLTADYAHSGGIKLIPDWHEKAVFISIPNAKFSVDKLTEDEFVLSENNQPKLVKKIGNTGMAEIELEATGNISIKNENGEEIFASEPEFDYFLTFDNDCEKDKLLESTGDFEMIYNLVEDKNDPGRKFEVSRYLGIMTLTKNNEMVFMNNRVRSTVRGLPCHKVLIGNTNGLP